MPHAPVVCKTLNGEDEGAAPENAIDGINHSHESRLTVVIMERHLAEEIRLYEVERRDPTQNNTGLVIVEIFAVDGA